MCLPRPNLVDTGSHAPATVRADGNHGPADLRFLTASDNPRGTGLAGPFGPFRPPLQDTRGEPVKPGRMEPAWPLYPKRGSRWSRGAWSRCWRARGDAGG